MHTRGTCRVSYVQDVARGVDLRVAESRLVEARPAAFRHKGRAVPGGVGAPPVRGSWPTSVVELDRWTAAEGCDVSVYDLGCVVVAWTIPFDGPLEDLVALSALLYENAELLARTREVVAEVVRTLGDSVDGPRTTDLVEDYVTFSLGALEGGADALLAAGDDVARVLRAEEGRLSRQEVEDALDDVVSYRTQDACFVDWHAAVLVGDDVADELLVLELANVELLQLRLLDLQLDREIDEAYRVLAEPAGSRGVLATLFGRNGRKLERIGLMRAEDMLSHEGIDNPLKLFGDDYLARLYRTVGERFHFDEWDAAIQRRLGVLDRIYEPLADGAAHRRSEILEWIIILLIAVDIVIAFLFD